ncbi:MAG: HypC/HybG/HupF family hydrogenase formation chaperone [Bacteroidales bacterium]
MCLAIPGIITKLYNDNGMKMAKVSFSGVIKTVSAEWVPEAKPGDYIISHAGTAISILNPVEAEETLRLFDEMKQSDSI